MGAGGSREQAGRKPPWLKVKAPHPRRYRATTALLGDLDLHTVCSEARCPNKGECFGSGTASFLILGEVCTRACRFCAVEQCVTGTATAAGSAGLSFAGPAAPDPDEPRRLAEAAARLGLEHVVVTSVTRDDVRDGGAGHFAAVVTALRERLPVATVEVLIPDLGGDGAALAAVLAARPDVLNHNLETVPRLYAGVRPQADYARSLELLRRASAWAGAATTTPLRPRVKSGLMVGLGETRAEVLAVLADCAAVGVDIVTVGQYLRPRAGCLPVARYVAPGEFDDYAREGARLGLRVAAAPFVRSSYRAAELLAAGDAGHPAGDVG